MWLVVLLEPPEGLLELVQPKKKERVLIRGLLPASAQSLHGGGAKLDAPDASDPQRQSRDT